MENLNNFQLLEYAAWAHLRRARPVDAVRHDPHQRSYSERHADLIERRRDRGRARRSILRTKGPATGDARSTAIHGEKISLLRVLGPGHVWALGVGIVLVGEYMGWNFAVGKGGALAALIACWMAGLLYTCVAMIDSEVTSTVAAAGGQYAQAKHIVGPLMAFNVGLFLVLAYTMLEAGNAITAGYLVADRRRHGRASKACTTSRSSCSPSCSSPGSTIAACSRR